MGTWGNHADRSRDRSALILIEASPRVRGCWKVLKHSRVTKHVSGDT